jgi:uncharacterized protein YrrD
MKTRLVPAVTTVVLSLGLALGQADTTTQTGMDTRFEQRAASTDLRASNLLGATVYRSDTFHNEFVIEGARDDWETVANVDDVILSQNGEVQGVLLDVGGFLGIGARTVMVGMDSLQLVFERDSDAVYVLMNATREQLENAPEFDVNTVSSQARSDFEGRVGVPEVRDERYQTVDTTALTADDLTGAVVYDRFGDRVTGISDVVLGTDGESIEGVIVDVGGFLGLFSRSVMVGLDQLQIEHDAQTGDARVYLNLSQAELESLPEHNL